MSSWMSGDDAVFVEKDKAVLYISNVYISLCSGL